LFIAARMPTLLNIVGSGPQWLAPPPVLRDLYAEIPPELSAASAPIARAANGSWWRWQQALQHARSTEMLRVLAVGASVTAGCGSSEPPAEQRCLRTGGPLSRRCSHEAGWVRVLADALPLELGGILGPAVSIETSVMSRNAVTAAYFARCTKAWIHRDTHVILLDIAQLNAGLAAALPQVVKAMRRAAPFAVIALLAWRSQADMGTVGAAGRAAMETGIDILRTDLLAKSLVFTKGSMTTRDLSNQSTQSKQRPQLGVCVPRSILYAQLGHDKIHPSPEGHKLIGRAAAHFVGSRLRRATDASGADGVVGADKAEGASSDSGWERCFLQASELWDHLAPDAASRGGWRLVDDGGEKGIRKLGLLSEEIGNRMRLAPIGPQESDRCTGGHFLVEVGYRLSRNESHGAFSIACAPPTCHCTRIRSVFAHQLAPFPRVNTNARLSANPDYRDPSFSATVTASTMFVASAERGTRCEVHVAHVEGACVRIDGLSMSCDSHSVTATSSADTGVSAAASAWRERDDDITSDEALSYRQKDSEGTAPGPTPRDQRRVGQL
jgi:hypothetical protein